MNSTCSLLVYFLNVNEVKTNYCLSSSRLPLVINTIHAKKVGGPRRNRSKSFESMSKVLGSLGSMLRC